MKTDNGVHYDAKQQFNTHYISNFFLFGKPLPLWLDNYDSFEFQDVKNKFITGDD